MKKFVVVAVLAVAMFSVATVANAFDLPTKVPTSADDVKNVGGTMALEKALNSKIEKANCQFKGDTEQTTCDLKKLANELAAASKGAKEMANYNVEIKVEAGPAKGKKTKVDANTRADAVVTALKGGLGGVADSWRYNTSTTKDANALKISAKVSK